MISAVFFEKFFKITKNKTFEISSGVEEYWQFFQFNLRANRKTDHAGFLIYFELFGFYFSIEIYDNRHWDWEKNAWENLS